MGYRFEKLRVWQKAMDFCTDVYDRTRDFPKEESYGITSQFRRAATSIPLNIAEGCACKTVKEFIQYLYIALRSQYEVVTIIKLSDKLRYLDAADSKELSEKIADVGKLLQALINSLQNKSAKKQPMAKT